MLDLASAVANPHVQFWKIAPGQNARLWEDCLGNNIICVEWNEIGDMRKEINDSKFKEKYRGVYGARRLRLWKEIWSFAKEIKKGDVVVANNGLKSIVGVGIVTGDYWYDENRAEYKHCVPIQWEITTEFPVPDSARSVVADWFRGTIKELSQKEYNVLRGEDPHGALSNLSSPTAIKLAIEECDRLGRDRFLSRYGFGHAREYSLRYRGNEYDSKAIVGVAHGYQFPELGHLKHSEFSGGIASSGAATKAFSLGFDVGGMQRRLSDWTLDQCEAAVEVYFEGLRNKLSGQNFNRAQACRSVAEKIGRPQGAVDFKFQNIDAILFEHGLPRMMNGIAPNIQHLLEFVVLDPLAPHNAVFDTAPERTPSITSTEGVLVEPPSISSPGRDDGEAKSRVTRKVDFARQDANNRRLGRCGEEWVVCFEKKRLIESGREDLAEQIDWVANRLGDGLGYDIRSFDENGNEPVLEVKTTNAGILTPFFISPNEIAVAERESGSYRLYRVFDFSTSPRAYVLTGPLRNKLTLTPQVFSAIPVRNNEKGE